MFLRALGVAACWLSAIAVARVEANSGDSFVAVMDMDMMILPGTAGYLEETIKEASESGAKAVVVKLDTPGGILETSQQMIQTIFSSPLPIVIYVSPSGSTATSAGVFITMAGHIAAMAPGTSIGAAHPVMGDGKDIQGDMRAKAENMTVAMVKAIADRRGRNVSWAEKAVKESASITEKEALKLEVVDLVAEDLNDLLRQMKGKTVRLESGPQTMEDLSTLPRRYFEISYKYKALNVLANPNVAALLWLAATTGISLELYNPGAILPGVVGVICLILALAVSQIIPVSQGAILLIVVGAVLIGAELYTGTLILGAGGIVAMVLGAMYLVDVSRAPGMEVAMELVLPVAVILGLLLLWVARRAYAVFRTTATTGEQGLVGKRGAAAENIGDSGRVFINGEYWNACSPGELLEKGAAVEVVAVKNGMLLEVKRVV